MISEDDVISFVSEHQQTFTTIGSSFFEMTVGMAFDHFNKEKVDFAVVETGMGGRLDTTNLCFPLISIITNIGLDHTAFLGDTIEKIAFEKAGIIKEKVPVVIGRHNADSDKVFIKKAKELNSQITFAEDLIELKNILVKDKPLNYFDVWHNQELLINMLESPLLGDYQKENIATAITSLKILTDEKIIDVTSEDLKEGIQNVIKNTGLKGRWQIIEKKPLVIADTGHNIDGILAIVSQLRSMKFHKLHMVFGMVSDKNTIDILSLLPKNARYYFCRPDIPRGLDEHILMESAISVGLTGETYSSVANALNSAKNNCGIDDIVFVGGSTFVVAEVV